MNAKVKDNSLHNTLVYVKQHWQLYVFFLYPAKMALPGKREPSL